MWHVLWARTVARYNSLPLLLEGFPFANSDRSAEIRRGSAILTIH